MQSMINKTPQNKNPYHSKGVTKNQLPIDHNPNFCFQNCIEWHCLIKVQNKTSNEAKENVYKYQFNYIFISFRLRKGKTTF